MITDDQLQLITAAIDGELSAADARRVRRLLRASPEAREVHNRLKADSARLKTLPVVAPPTDLAARVVERIAAFTPPPVHVPRNEPASAPFATKPGRIPRWVPAALAASVLIAITTGSFLFFTRDNSHTDSARDNHRDPGRSPVVSPDELAKFLPRESEHPSAPLPHEHQDHASIVRNDAPPSSPLVGEHAIVAPPPRYLQPDALTFPPRIAPKFDLLQVRIPFLRSVSEFDRAENRQELAEELARDPAFRIDLFTRDAIRGVQLLQNAAKVAGVKLLIDATTLDRLNKRQAAAVMLYTDSLTADEISQMIGKLAAVDAKISPRVFGQLHVVPVSRGDEKYLAETLGHDPGLFKRTDLEKRPPSPVSGKPISDGTANHIVDRVTGGGGVKAGEKVAIVMTWTPSLMRTIPSASPELKQFFKTRGDRKPGVVPVVLVIRPGNG